MGVVLVVPVYAVRPIVLVVIERVIAYNGDNFVGATGIGRLLCSRIVTFRVTRVCSRVNRALNGYVDIFRQWNAVFFLINDHVRLS